MAEKSLRNKTVKGIAWTSIHKFTSMGVQFIAGIVLARLLSPDDYGCIGMLSIFLMIATSIVDSGFSLAIIQKKEPTQEDYSTVFYWNICVAVIMYVILFLTAPLIASFYRMPLLSSVLRVQGISLILNALRSIQNSQLIKQFKFKKIAIVMLASQSISLACTIYMAYQEYGVWALVAMHLISSFIPAVVFWVTSNWKPSLCFSKKSFQELFSFGFFVFLSSLLNNFCNNVQGLLIGRFCNPSTMGFYSKAKGTEELASTSISQVLTQVILPLCSELQNDKESLINVLSRLSKSISFITFPLMAILILLAKMIFTILYSEKWLPSVPYFQILCLAGVAFSMVEIGAQAIVSIGKSKLSFKWNIIKRSFGLLLMLIGLYFGGIKGLLIGMVIQTWFNYMVSCWLMSNHIGYRMINQIKDLTPMIVITLLSFIISYLLTVMFDLNLYIEGIIRFFSFIIIYFVLSYIFKVDSLPYCKNIVLSLINKR